MLGGLSFHSAVMMLGHLPCKLVSVGGIKFQLFFRRQASLVHLRCEQEDLSVKDKPPPSSRSSVGVDVVGGGGGDVQVNKFEYVWGGWGSLYGEAQVNRFEHVLGGGARGSLFGEGPGPERRSQLSKFEQIQVVVI